MDQPPTEIAPPESAVELLQRLTGIDLGRCPACGEGRMHITDRRTRGSAAGYVIDDSEYGKFAWVIDPEGNKVQLWQPPAGQ